MDQKPKQSRKAIVTRRAFLPAGLWPVYQKPKQSRKAIVTIPTNTSITISIIRSETKAKPKGDCDTPKTNGQSSGQHAGIRNQSKAERRLWHFFYYCYNFILFCWSETKAKPKGDCDTISITFDSTIHFSNQKPKQSRKAIVTFRRSLRCMLHNFFQSETKAKPKGDCDFLCRDF